VIVVLVIVVVVLLVYGVLAVNRRSTRSAGARRGGYSHNARAQRQTRDESQRDAAAREELAAGLAPARTGPAETAEQCLGVAFGASGGSGLVVESVSPGSAAARVGMAPGAVLVSVNGVVPTAPGDADAAIADRRAGLPVYLVWRADGADHQADVVV
jgi:S1-C subfamily serine protease